MTTQDDQSTKTEEPTEKKLRDARKKGDVPSSREPSNLMGVLSLLIIVAFFAPTLFPNLASVFQEVITGAAQTRIGVGHTGLSDLSKSVEHLSGGVVSLLTPVMAVMILGAVFGVLVQGETVIALERVKPKASKVSPLAGLKRLISAESLVEFSKNLLKLLIVAAIAVYIGREAVTGVWQSDDFLPEHIMSFGGDAAAMILVATTGLLVFTSGLDVIWKRQSWNKKQRMSHREVRDEHKDSEGDPHIKAKRASLRRQRSRQRIATAVPTATVVVTNPTHFAVALRYEMGRDVGPVCVAKGTDNMAAQIRKLARAADVPIIENRALARALHATVEVDDVVPVEHWQAAAEIIGYVLGLRRGLKQQPPKDSRLRIED